MDLTEDGRVEGNVLNFSCKTPKLQLTAEQPLTGECWIPSKKDAPGPRAKEKPQQVGWRGNIEFWIKQHTHQRRLEGSRKTLCAQDLGALQVTEPDLHLSVWASSVEAWIISGLPWEQRFWLQWTWEVQRVSPTIEPLSRQTTNWRTSTPKMFSCCCKSSRAHNRFPNLGIWQRDWEPAGNLTLNVSRI